MIDEEWSEFDDGETREFGRAKVGPQVLEFAIGVEFGALDRTFPPPAIPAPPSADAEAMERHWARLALARVDTIEGAMREAMPGLEVRLRAEIQGPVAGGGGGGIEGELLRILVGDDPLGRVADLVALGIALRGLKGWIEDRTKARVEISDGVAVVFASEALQEATGITDSTLAFVAAVPPKNVDEMGSLDGYVVALRTGDVLRLFTVSPTGIVAAAGEWPIETRAYEMDDLEA